MKKFSISFDNIRTEEELISLMAQAMSAVVRHYRPGDIDHMQVDESLVLVEGRSELFRHE